MTDINKIKQARLKAGLTQKELCDRYDIPVRTLQGWEGGSRKPPEYVLNLLLRCIELDFSPEAEPTEQEDLSVPKKLIFLDHIGKPLKEPVSSAIPVQDDPQEPAYDTLTTDYDDVENPITDELLAELNKITDD